MIGDSLRNKMDVKFYCSKHPDTQLNFSHSLSRIGAHSACEVDVKIVVHPCEMCQMEVERIEDAVSVLLSVKKR